MWTDFHENQMAGFYERLHGFAETDLDFRPQTTLAEGLAAEYAWLQTLWSDVRA